MIRLFDMCLLSLSSAAASYSHAWRKTREGWVEVIVKRVKNARNRSPFSLPRGSAPGFLFHCCLLIGASAEERGLNAVFFLFFLQISSHLILKESKVNFGSPSYRSS